MSQSEQVATQPLTWLMLGHKAGDNGQLRALAENLPWPVLEKHLRYRKTEIFTNLFAGPTLKGLKTSQSSALEPPWPDLIISAGRRNEPLVRWVQQQARPKRVKLVHVGRPWALHECFDLIITTPQYRLPLKPNILHNEAPLHLITPEKLERGRETFQKFYRDLTGPFLTVIMGGHAGPYQFDRENAALLGHYASKMAAEKGMTILATSSARTPPFSINAFEEQIKVPFELYRWQPDAEHNPYQAFLGAASSIIVTCDSMSMLAEACTTRKPVYIFDLLRGKNSNRPPLPADGSIKKRLWSEWLQDFSLRPFFYKLGMTVGPSRLTRDVSIIHQNQISARRAAWLGQDASFNIDETEPISDLKRAAERIIRLCDEKAPLPPTMPASHFPEWLQRFTQG